MHKDSNCDITSVAHSWLQYTLQSEQLQGKLFDL